MKEYLENKTGKKLGITRAGFPKEVYFEAVLKRVDEQVAVFEDDDGEEIAIPLDKIIMVGKAEREEEERNKPGFL